MNKVRTHYVKTRRGDIQKRVNEIYLRDEVPTGIDPENLLDEQSTHKASSIPFNHSNRN